MTREQRLFKNLIIADLIIVERYYADEDKALRFQAAYHMQQAIEKTIKLKADLNGLNLWGHNIEALLKSCDDKGVDIEIPKYIRDRANQITSWEAECRYYPVRVVRKDSLKKLLSVTKDWLG